jgi:hypothetical protein
MLALGQAFLITSWSDGLIYDRYVLAALLTVAAIATCKQ